MKALKDIKYWLIAILCLLTLVSVEVDFAKRDKAFNNMVSRMAGYGDETKSLFSYIKEHAKKVSEKPKYFMFRLIIILCPIIIIPFSWGNQKIRNEIYTLYGVFFLFSFSLYFYDAKPTLDLSLSELFGELCLAIQHLLGLGLALYILVRTLESKFNHENP